MDENWASNRFAYGDPVLSTGEWFYGRVVAAFLTLAGKVQLVVDNGHGILQFFKETELERGSFE